ncbi:hypothetical protein KQI63_08175 [bacterium]|nr:hypothetical protein [bacterium]
MSKPSIGFFSFGDEIIRENPGLLIFVLATLASAFFWSGTVVQGLMILALIVLFSYLLAAYLRVPPMVIRGIRTVDVIAELAFVALFLIKLFPKEGGTITVGLYALFAIPFAIILMRGDKSVSRIWTLQGVLFLAAVFAVLGWTDNRTLPGLAIFLLGAQNVATGMYYRNLRARRLLPTLTAFIIALLGAYYHFGVQ